MWTVPLAISQKNLNKSFLIVIEMKKSLLFHREIYRFYIKTLKWFGWNVVTESVIFAQNAKAIFEIW